jgi:hypothetical protein
VRRIEEALAPLRAFFRSANQESARFNHIGEWHSHPSFAPVPSPRDDESMREIAQDTRVGANFVVLLIVRLPDEANLDASVNTYLPDGSKHLSLLKYADAGPDPEAASKETSVGARE